MGVTAKNAAVRKPQEIALFSLFAAPADGDERFSAIGRTIVAAKAIHMSVDSVRSWMVFKADDTMPPAQWLLLNTYTLAVKGICWPDATQDYVRARFPNAFPDAIVRTRRTFHNFHKPARGKRT